MIIEFTPGTTLLRERDRPSALPIVRNGPPGTFVLFPGGLRVSLPTDQIVWMDDAQGCARVEFGGMEFTGTDAGRLVFDRVRELAPEEQLSPERSHRMLLDCRWVTHVSQGGRVVYAPEP